MTEAAKPAATPAAKPAATPAARSFIVEAPISIKGKLFSQGDKVTEADAPKEVLERYRKIGKLK